MMLADDREPTVRCDSCKVAILVGFVDAEPSAAENKKGACRVFAWMV